MFKGVFSAVNNKVENATFSTAETSFKFLEANNTIEIKLRGMGINFQSEYSLMMNPKFFQDEGTLRIGFSALDITIIVEPYLSKEGRVLLNIGDFRFEVNPADVPFELNANNDMMRSLG